MIKWGWVVKDEDGNILGRLLSNHGMTREEICNAVGIELAITEDDYFGIPENGKYDIESLVFENE